MTMQGIRGATTVQQDRVDLVMQATRDLLESIQQMNPGLQPTDIASVFFTTTADLDFRLSGAGSPPDGLDDGADDVRPGDPGSR